MPASEEQAVVAEVNPESGPEQPQKDESSSKQKDPWVELHSIMGPSCSWTRPELGADRPDTFKRGSDGSCERSCLGVMSTVRIDSLSPSPEPVPDPAVLESEAERKCKAHEVKYPSSVET